MKAFLIFGLVVGGGVGLWRLWIYCRAEKDLHVSGRWVTDRERLDLIASGQWDGYVRWPWDGDDAA